MGHVMTQHDEFGAVWIVKSARSAAISSAVDSEDQTEDACKSDDPTAPPSKRRRFTATGRRDARGTSTETNLSKGAVQ